MSSEKRSFAELLADAPLMSPEGKIEITGALLRSDEPGKFVLKTGDNQILTLDVDAVRGYQVLSGMVGQTVVQVEVDRESVPPSYVGVVTGGGPGGFKPILGDTGPFNDAVTFRETSIEYSQQGLVDYQNYAGVPGPFAGVAPFALATPHQVAVNSPDLVRTHYTHPYLETGPATDPSYSAYGYNSIRVPYTNPYVEQTLSFNDHSYYPF